MSDANTAAARLAIMRSGLRLPTKLVAIRILDLQGLELGACVKGASTLAQECAVSVEAVRTAFKELRRAGLLVGEEPEPGKRARRSIDVEALAALEAKTTSKKPAPRVPTDPGSHEPGSDGTPTRVHTNPHPGSCEPVPGFTRTRSSKSTIESTIESTSESVAGAHAMAPPAEPEPSAHPPPVEVRDPESAGRRMRQLLAAAWSAPHEAGGLGRPGFFPPGEHGAAQAAGVWLWDAVGADAQRFAELAPRLVRRWSVEPFVRNQLRFGTGRNFRDHAPRLLEEELAAIELERKRARAARLARDRARREAAGDADALPVAEVAHIGAEAQRALAAPQGETARDEAKRESEKRLALEREAASMERERRDLTARDHAARSDFLKRQADEIRRASSAGPAGPVRADRRLDAPSRSGAKAAHVARALERALPNPLDHLDSREGDGFDVYPTGDVIEHLARLGLELVEREPDDGAGWVAVRARVAPDPQLALPHEGTG